MDVFKDQLVESLQALRVGKGLTAEKLKSHSLLMHMLDVDADTSPKGVKKLDDLSMLIDSEKYWRKAVRNALAIGYDVGRDVGDRRKSITVSSPGKTAEIPLESRQLQRYEDEGFEMLADIIIQKSDSPLLRIDKPETILEKIPERENRTDSILRDMLLTNDGGLDYAIISLILLIVIIATGSVITSTPLRNEFFNADKVLADRLDHVDPKGANSATTALSKPPVSVIGPASQANTSGWGPKRPMFTDKDPAPYAAFNSITDNLLHGDERNFTQCRDKENSNWATRLQALDGHIYQCYIWFENAAAPNIAKDNPAAWLHDARARVTLPENAPASPSLVAILSAANSRTVWSSVQFTSTERVSLLYEKGTTGIQRIPYYDDFRPVSDTIATSGGIKLGGEKFDGIIRQDVGYVLFDVGVKLEKLD